MLVYLIGYMGSGKSTIGKKLASALNFSFLDLDTEIEQKYHTTIPDIFQRFDETTFRLLENKALKESFNESDTVVATGGGTACFYDNMKLINKHGISVYIKMHPQSLLQRLLKAKKKRPLIDKKTPEEIIGFIEEQILQREVFYQQANIAVKGESINVGDLANQIIGFQKNKS
ncbi:MAG: AAA family ATPase [Bacteroidales bacterium]|nr:AAA family ATPase [Bacteroidales bacterium]MCF8404348.1 AAA family ATPase [Bacteroidales bacterium]